jgi:predicted RNA-binding Zn-ribbon protein involved in translation (DUF1610 family)
MKDVLIKIAYDEKGHLVIAKDAVKGNKYFCPECGEELIYKNSGKSGPGSRCPHFAHKGGGHNCDPESVLHAVFKKEAATLLNSFLNEKKAFVVDWRCRVCNTPYSGNLLYCTKTISVEYDMKVCRPDIALLDDSGKVRVALEVVYTHSPEENTLAFYRENGIVLVQYNVHPEDLPRLVEKLHKPDVVSLCLNKKCSGFTSNMLDRHLVEDIASCRSCGKQSNVFYIEYSSALGLVLFNKLEKNDLLELEKRGITADMLMDVTFSKYNCSFNAVATKCLCKPKVVIQLPRPRIRRKYPL